MGLGSRGGFEFQTLEPIGLKGISDPVEACEVQWQPTSQQRIPLPPAVAPVADGPFVGQHPLSSAEIIPGRGSTLRICTYSARRSTIRNVDSIMRSQLGLSGAVYTCMCAGSQ